MTIPEVSNKVNAEGKKNTPANSIYDIEISSINGEPLELGKFKGKYLLFVNVASKCGFTKQYRGLQELSDEYSEDLVVIGFPCNQFGGQEPGKEEEIKSFCEMRYGVSFPLSEKIKVKGSQQHPVYQWLTKKELNGRKSSTVRWNFQKYLVGPNGDLIDVFYSITSPTSNKIVRHLRKGAK